MKLVTRIVTSPVDPRLLIKEIAGDADGAVATFEGRVRDHHRDRRVERLEYHAYAEMAAEELERIGGDLGERFDVGGIGLVHRTGDLPVGEISVVVAVAAAHRRDALAACAAGIEAIKRSLPVWKKEFFSDGEPEWIFGPDEACVTGSAVPASGDSGD